MGDSGAVSETLSVPVDCICWRVFMQRDVFVCYHHKFIFLVIKLMIIYRIQT